MKIEIKERKLTAGNRSLYLEYYETGFRKKENLHLYLVPENSPKAKKLNRETYDKARVIRAERLLNPPSFEKKSKQTEGKNEKAEALTQTRLRAFEELNKRISGTLDFLNMPGVRMTLRHTRGPLASHGQDSIEFYISTNPGEAPKPLAKIASGGELSRITLAIKNAMADKDAVPTVIYDEIDSGVSGKAAGRIGEVLRQSAQGHQILCITHTAQIAALADCHLLIQKNVANDRTYTEIHPLDEEGRVEALARLISGDHVTELSRANAREMLGLGAK